MNLILHDMCPRSYFGRDGCSDVVLPVCDLTGGPTGRPEKFPRWCVGSSAVTMLSGALTVLLALFSLTDSKQKDFYTFKVVNSRGKLVSLEKYRGSVSLCPNSWLLRSVSVVFVRRVAVYVACLFFTSTCIIVVPLQTVAPSLSPPFSLRGNRPAEILHGLLKAFIKSLVSVLYRGKCILTSRQQFLGEQ